MLPSVPDQLTKDAVAIGQYHRHATKMMSEVSRLAQKIQSQIFNVLSSLQIGDITRQRIEHIQSGLTLLSDARAAPMSNGMSDDACDRFDRYIYGLLAHQLHDTAETFSLDTKHMAEMIAEISVDTDQLLRTQLDFSNGAEGGGLRSLESSVAQALELVADLERSAEGASLVHLATTKAVKELETCVDSVKNVKEDVQFMAINTTVRCSRLGDLKQAVGSDCR